MSNSLPPALPADRITAILRAAGVPGAATVRSVSVDSIRTMIMSQITRLRIEYDGPAPDAPASLILKTAHPDRATTAWSGARNEVAFYHNVAPAMVERLVPRCFAAHWDAASHDWYLLLEDLTDSHATLSDWPLPPNEAQCRQIVALRARFHAAWWNDPRLGDTIGQRRDPTLLQAWLADAARRFAEFVDRFGEYLPAERRHLYECYFAAAPGLLDTPQARNNLTIVQGDAHVWNCFLPRDGGDDARLYDWDSWRLDAAATDLAHMMTVHWYPDRRRRLEQPLLDHYHAVLLSQGVHGYSRAALEADYHLATLRQIMWPVWQAVYGVPPVIWWNNLERVWLAVEDLDCVALLA